MYVVVADEKDRAVRFGFTISHSHPRQRLVADEREGTRIVDKRSTRTKKAKEEESRDGRKKDRERKKETLAHIERLEDKAAFRRWNKSPPSPRATP